ncbi:MAG: hypothetical protein U0703_02320 [Anaerolineae bacterium]
MSKKPRDPNRRSDADDFESFDDEERWQRPRDRFPTLPDEPTPPPRRRRAPETEREVDSMDRTRNLITVLFLLGTVAAIAYFVTIWQNPYSPLNPLSPPTPLPLMITATYTPAPTSTPAPTLTLEPSSTPTEFPTLEPTPTFTPVFLEALSTETGISLEPGDAANYRFDLQQGHPIYLTNPDARGGCRWSSIAGSVISYEGDALNGYGVRIAGEGVDETVATGSAPGFGPGGFEVPLGNEARDAQFVAQLLDPQGTPVSPVYTVATLSQCDFNIAALRFVETEPSS